MPKTVTQFVCKSCGAASPKWSGRCLACEAWNSLEQAAAQTGGGQPLKCASLQLVASKSSARITSGLADFDQVLGGGLVPGGVVLMAGDPGVGKSTLALQVAAAAAKLSSVLYVSGEESAEQIKLRADRLGAGASGLEVVSATEANAVAATVRSGQFSLMVVDSIQTMTAAEVAAGAGSITQITASAQLIHQAAKAAGTAVMMIGHVTKEGAIAGPRVLEHLVDVVLYLEGERYGSFKLLRGVKNRFGPSGEVGLFELGASGMTGVANPSAALLTERHSAPGSAVLATIEGNRPLLVEVQALVSTSVFGYPKRTASGIDFNRLNLLIAVLSKRAGLNLSNQDVYVNIVGGLKITEPAADLAIILAIASAFKNRPIKTGLVAFGEVGLSGEIRSVSQVPKRLAEASKLGFNQALGPGNTPSVIAAKTVSDAVQASLQSK